MPIDTRTHFAARRLRAAGWSLGDVAGSSRWLLTGINGENLIYAVGESQAAAWQLAVVQAAAVGMLGD
jgi:hypothetical protein